MLFDDRWRVSGTYMEACNCEAICPCRTVDGRRGGRSTYGLCTGALSWGIERGHAGPVDVSELAVGLVFRYSDDEPGSPWTFVLYLDERADRQQRDSLEEIFRIHRYASVRIAGAVGDDAAVTCAIPGYHQRGSELLADELTAGDGPFKFEFPAAAAIRHGSTTRGPPDLG